MHEFDFTQEVEFKVKTKSGETVLREPSVSEYLKYLKDIENFDGDADEIYNYTIDYFQMLGGDPAILKSLSLARLRLVNDGVNGQHEKK